MRLLKRTFIVCGFLILFISIEALNWFFILLDEIFYPSYRKIAVKNPVFIVGMPRTGSTYLHNILYNDRQNFTSPKLWEMLFCPSIVQKRIVRFLFFSGYNSSSHLKAYIQKLDKFFFRNYYPLHPTGLFHIEEDDFLLMPVAACQTFVYMFPGINYFRKLAYFDSKLGKTRKALVMHFYKRSIQKHLFVHGRNRIYLSKCPFNTGKMNSLARTFPGARFICLTREPQQAIPSAIALMLTFSRIYQTSGNVEETRNRVLRVADSWYSYPLGIMENSERNNFLVIDYKVLISQTDRVVKDIYHHLGILTDEATEEALNKEIRNGASYRSGRSHSPEQYGLDAEALKARYEEIYRKLTEL